MQQNWGLLLLLQFHIDGPLVSYPIRSFSSEAEDPLLWASTYQAGPHLQQLAAAQAAQAATQAAAAGSAAGSSADTQAAAAPSSQQPRLLPRPQQQQQQPRASLPLHPSTQRYALLPAGGMDARKAAVRGYKAQAARVLEHVDRLLTGGFCAHGWVVSLNKHSLL